MTDMTWGAFQKMTCARLDVDATHARLAYRLYVDGSSDASGLRVLLDEHSWHEVVNKIGEGYLYSDDLELEILDVNNAVSSTLTCL
jgi:hypothetical protein